MEDGLFELHYVKGEWAVASEVTGEDAIFCENNFYQGGYDYIQKKYGWN